MSRTAHDQLVHFLSDMYAVEQQALAQLVSAPEIAGDPKLAADFRQHYNETEQQAELVRARLEAHGASPSALKNAVMKLGGKSFLLFARAQPETPGRLVAHSYSYEAMEWAGYEMLTRFAEHAGDGQTVETARIVGSQERAMMERLENGFDAAERASHADASQEKMNDQLRKHVAEAHALENQSIQLLKKSEMIAGDPVIAQLYKQQLDTTHGHARLLEQRLATLGADTSTVKDSALALGGFNWSVFFHAQSDTPAKLAAFVYAVLHLEIGGYELLKRSAERAGDTETQRLCENLLTDKRSMAGDLSNTFDAAVASTLDVVKC